MEGQSDYNNRGASDALDFSFAYDNSEFSDRVLWIKIMPDPPESITNEDSNGEVNDNHNGDGKILYSCNMDWSAAVRVQTLHVSTLLLAAKSPFFFKLFSNGMMESDKRDVTIHISCSEEVSFMDLLNFMYSGTLNAQTKTALVDVLIIADKFEVVSCVHYCMDALENLAVVTPEFALPESAEGFLIEQLSENKKFEEEIINLPLTAIEDVLSKDELRVISEDVLYDIVINWARKHYPDAEERGEILSNRLSHLIRFPQMTNRKLKKILHHRQRDCLSSLKLVVEALLFKAGPPYKRKFCTPEESHHKRFCQRTYTCKPINVVEFDAPHRECMVFWDIKKDDCLTLFPNKWLISQAFYLGGEPFHLIAHCSMGNDSQFPYFGLWLMMENKHEAVFRLDYEFAARTKPSGSFSVKLSGLHRFCSKKIIGSSNLFGMPWNIFISKNSPYFMDDIIHLRAVLTMKT